MATQYGNYIDDSEIDNWADGATDTEKLAVIDRIEEWVERITHDYFYERKFDIYLDGNGQDKLFLNLIPAILSVTSIEISTTSLSSSYWTYDNDSVHRDPGSVTSLAELRWLLRQYKSTGLFPRGIDNIHVEGTYGWPERLDMDAVLGTFEPFETITGGTSDATAIVERVETTYLIIRGRSGTFEDNEEITGGTSAATADVDNTSGAVNDPPEAIKRACIVLCRYDNDNTQYSYKIEGSEGIGGYTYQTKVKALTGIKVADDLLRLYVRRKPQMAIV